MTTAGQGAAAAYDAAVYTRSAAPGQESPRLRKVRAAVGYFERETAAAQQGVENAAGKAARLRQQADEAEATAQTMLDAAGARLADARRQLAEAELEG